ncbi:MAG: hypothetical protein GYA51_08825, partial [Candidatus Methanofastidiosa archaeon]|nr:hypothetical protein [Candidatus Methanofastidiosa archaeon]
FPREIILVETSSDELDFKKPNIPIDTKLYPIYVANRKIESLTTKIVKQSRIRDYVLPIYPQIVHSSLSTQSLASQKNNWCTVNRDTNSIKIYIKDLLHKITISFDDEISIIPLIGGNLEIKGNIICEEYTSKEEFTLNINIKEQ